MQEEPLENPSEIEFGENIEVHPPCTYIPKFIVWSTITNQDELLEYHSNYLEIDDTEEETIELPDSLEQSQHKEVIYEYPSVSHSTLIYSVEKRKSERGKKLKIEKVINLIIKYNSYFFMMLRRIYTWLREKKVAQTSTPLIKR